MTPGAVQTESSGRQRLRFLLIGFWILPAMVAVIGFQIVPSARNPDISLAALALSQLLCWFAWGLWTPVIVAVSERVPFLRGQIVRAFLAHLATSVAVVCAQILVMAYVWQWFDLSPVRSLESKLAIGFRSYGDLFVVIYWAVVGAHAGLRWYEAWQAQGLVAAQLERDLSAAQLTTLRSQLNPHFLFNALNSVVTLIPRDQEGATRMVVRLADLLRATLGMAEQQEIELARELQMVKNYLEIELVRFPDRLVVRWDVDPATHSALVPAFALQPLVENAIVHGVSRRGVAGEITIVASATKGMLRLSVRDNGPGPTAIVRSGSRAGAGIGLANLRARLQRLYSASEVDVSLRSAAGGGALATILLPLRLAPVQATGAAREAAPAA